MTAIQLEFNMENKEFEELQLFQIQQQIDLMHESMGKVRRKIFSEVSEVKKICSSLQRENEELKSILRQLKDEKTEWVYSQGDYLFTSLKDLNTQSLF